MTITRRELLQGFGAGSLILTAPSLLRAQALPHVVVVGGGFAGSSVAKYLALWGAGELRVTLVDRSASHVSCVLSNLVLNRELSLDSLDISHSFLRDKLGIRVIVDEVVGVDADRHEIALGNGSTLDYDRLIMAPGIAFSDVEGWDPQQMPHAWIAGEQTTLLRDRINAMPTPGGHFLMTVPKAPYRCPPGPYERACLVADMLREKGGGTVTVLDANPDITAEAETFHRAFTELYADIIDYRANVRVLKAEGSSVLRTTAGTFTADIVNLIADQQAPQLLRMMGAVSGSMSWAPVDPLSYESIDVPDVHIVGDAQDTGQPKSAHMGNAQAKVCADAILCLLRGENIGAPERLRFVTTNSACYSPITRSEASWLSANYSYDAAIGKMTVTHIGEAGTWTRSNYRDMFTWANNLIGDSFM